MKNKYFDGHFDLNEANALVEKALKWFSKNSIQMKDILWEAQNNKKPLSELVHAAFEPHLAESTKQLIEQQKQHFRIWNEQRKSLIEAQVYFFCI